MSSKHGLGKALKKWPFVSAVGVLDYRGAEVQLLQKLSAVRSFKKAKKFLLSAESSEKTSDSICGSFCFCFS